MAAQPISVCTTVPIQWRTVDTPTGEQIRAHRERRGMSRRQVSELAQVDQSTIRRIERGEYNHPRKLAPVLAAIGWDQPDRDPESQARDLSNAQLMVEVSRRLAELEELRVQVRRLLAHPAPLAGSLPPSHQGRQDDNPAQSVTE